jgi:hypothetical protein
MAAVVTGAQARAEYQQIISDPEWRNFFLETGQGSLGMAALIIVTALTGGGGSGGGSGTPLSTIQAAIDTSTQLLEIDAKLGTISSILSGTRDYTSLIVADANGDLLVLTVEHDESLAPVETYYPLGGGAPVTPVLPLSNPGVGNTTIEVQPFVGADAAVNVTPGQELDRITILAPSGAIISTGWVDAITGVPLAGITAADVERPHEDAEQLLASILAALTAIDDGTPSNLYRSAPVSTFVNVNDAVTIDTSNMGTVSHDVGLSAIGFAPGETMTVQILHARSLTDVFRPIGRTFEVVVEQGDIITISGSSSGKPFKRVVLTDNSTVSGTLTVDFDVTAGGAGGI